MVLRSIFRRIARSPAPSAAVKPRQHAGTWYNVSKGILFSVFFLHAFAEYGYSYSSASGPSMLPTLSVIGDWIRVNRSHRRGRNIRVGDLVAFHHPVFSNARGVKRVIGMPGDYVLLDKPGTSNPDPPMIQVPEGHCWLVGDNLDASRDSRLLGPIPLALIIGKADFVSYPWAERRPLPNNMEKQRDSSDDMDSPRPSWPPA